MKYVLALDAGTTSVRALIFDEQLTLVAQASRAITQHYPRPGWVEHDPLEIISAQLGVMTEVQIKSGIQSDKIAAVGITNQRETVMLWDRETGKPCGPALVWQCRRTAEAMEALEKQGYAELIREKTGLVLDPYFSASKIAWLLDTIPNARARAEQGKLACGTVDSWLIYNLTAHAVHATDYTNASRTMLFNITTLTWDDELLEVFNIPRSLLPEVYPSDHLFGRIDSTLAHGTPPICGVAGDQQASLFGHGCFNKSDVKNTYGTGCFMLMNTGDKPVPSSHGLLTTVGIACNNQVSYALEGSVFIAGSLIQWLIDDLGILKDAAESQSLAQSIDSTDGVYIVPAFTGMGAPYWKPHARGLICGLTRGTTRAHIARAALESLAYQTADVLDAMRADAGVTLSDVCVDGGGSANAFTMQFQADILGARVIRAACKETTALGAALIAGLSAGVWNSRDELKQMREGAIIFEPQISPVQRYRLLGGWRDAVMRTLAQ